MDPKDQSLIEQRIRQLLYDRNLIRKQGIDVQGESYAPVRNELQKLRDQLKGGALETQPTTTLASLGQRYQDMPPEAPATFDERFGPYNVGRPALTDKDILRLFLQQQVPIQPGQVVPGSRSWPYGYTRI